MRIAPPAPHNSPFPILPVNLLILSVTPKMVFFAKLVAPYDAHDRGQSTDCTSLITLSTHPSDADTQLLVAVHDQTLVRLVEYVLDA